MTDPDGLVPLDDVRGRAGDQPWRYPPPKLRPVTWPDKPESIPARPWLVPGLIPDRNVTMISGDGGIGKSLLAQMLITSAVTSCQWLGRSMKACKAVGVFCEDDDDELRRRQHAINSHLGIEFGDLEGLSVICRAGEDNVLMQFERYESHGTQTHFFDRVMNYTIDFGAELVVLDSLHDLFAGNENSRPQVRQFIAMLRRLAIEIDGAVVVTAHPSLSGLSSGSGLSGSTAWNNAVRSRLYLERQQDDGGGGGADDVRILRTIKSNYGPAGGEIQLKWQDGVFVPLHAETGLTASIRRRSAERVFLELLNKVTKDGRHVSHSVHAAGNYAPKLFAMRPDREGFNKSDLEYAMERLFAAGRIHIEEYGRTSDRRSRIVATKTEGDEK